MTRDPIDVTQVLAELTGGDESAAARLMDVVYDELRALAGSCFRGQRAAHTLQPTALVNEAFVRITESASFNVKDRAHFFALCAIAVEIDAEAGNLRYRRRDDVVEGGGLELRRERRPGAVQSVRLHRLGTGWARD